MDKVMSTVLQEWNPDWVCWNWPPPTVTRLWVAFHPLFFPWEVQGHIRAFTIPTQKDELDNANLLASSTVVESLMMCLLCLNYNLIQYTAITDWGTVASLEALPPTGIFHATFYFSLFSEILCPLRAYASSPCHWPTDTSESWGNNQTVPPFSSYLWLSVSIEEVREKIQYGTW